MKVLVVVDMQNDFITGSLGTKEAQAIVPKVVEKVKNFDGEIFFTKDTHGINYLETQEGKKLPVEHCIYDTWGWEICDELTGCTNGFNTIDKSGFGSIRLMERLKDILEFERYFNNKIITEIEIELCGLCTGICVISNAIILKSAFPEAKITVDASCCACATPESHKRALEAMKICQIDIINE